MAAFARAAARHALRVGGAAAPLVAVGAAAQCDFGYCPWLVAPSAAAAPLAAKLAKAPAGQPTKDGPPDYFEPAVPYPGWDGDWDGRRADARHRKAAGGCAPTRHVLLVRHGQYDESSKDDAKRVLTPLGRRQARATGERIRALLDASNMSDPEAAITVRSSNLTRAKETAALIAPSLPRRARDLGAHADLNEGRPAQTVPGKAYARESVRADGERIERAFRAVFHRAAPRDDGGLHEYDVVVCHGNVIRYFALRALQLPPEAWLRLCTFNCSVTYLVIRPSGSVSLRCLGDIGHLDPDLVTFSAHEGLEW